MRITRLTNLAKGSVGFDVEGEHGNRVVIMTDKGWALLISTPLTEGRSVRGAQIATARKLVDSGLATLTDHGLTGDHDRWWMRRTDLGEALIQHMKASCDR